MNHVFNCFSASANIIIVFTNLDCFTVFGSSTEHNFIYFLSIYFMATIEHEAICSARLKKATWSLFPLLVCDKTESQGIDRLSGRLAETAVIGTHRQQLGRGPAASWTPTLSMQALSGHWRAVTGVFTVIFLCLCTEPLAEEDRFGEQRLPVSSRRSNPFAALWPDR